MSKRKLFLVAFITAFTLTAALCIVKGEALIFYPVNYGIIELVKFAFLIAFLCFCLVYINLAVLKFLKRFLAAINEKSFYVIGTLIILQIVTLATGLLESSMTTSQSNIFYYYEGVSNSLIYILTGNFTAALTAMIYAQEQIKIRQESTIKFDFDSKEK